MSEETFSQAVERSILSGFANTEKGDPTLETVLDPAQHYGTRGVDDQARHAFRLAVGNARALVRLAEMLDERGD